MHPLSQRIRALSDPLAPQPTGVAPRLPRLDGVRAVIFDVYGTLFISGSGDIDAAAAPENAQYAAEALAEVGFTGDLERAGRRAEELTEPYVRKSHAASRAAGVEFPEVEIRDIWRRIVGTLAAEGLIAGRADDEEISRLIVEYDCRVNPMWPMPGAAEALAALRARGIPLGIVSNAQFYTPLAFEAFVDGPPEAVGFAADLCVWSYRCGEAKPGAGIYRRLLDPLRERHGLEPRQALYVGNDVRNDIRPAAAVGLRTALFAGDCRSLRLRETDPDCAATRPDAVITELGQVLRLLSV